MEIETPVWLSDTLTVEPWNESTYGYLYKHFCTFIRDADLRYEKKGIVISKDIEDEREKIFWHITSKTNYIFNKSTKKKEPQRLTDIERCKRMSWVNPIVTNNLHEAVLAWDYLEGNKDIKTYLWLKDHDFVVIFKKLKNGRRILITSFHVSHGHNILEFERKYDDRIQ